MIPSRARATVAIALVAAVVVAAAVLAAGTAACGGSEAPPGMPAATVSEAGPDTTLPGPSGEAGPSPVPEVVLQPLPGRFDRPVYLAAAPGDDGRLFVVEKRGRVLIVEDGEVRARPFLDISSQVTSDGERGLLSMAFDPRFAENGRFYVDFTDAYGDTRVVRYQVRPDDPHVADAASGTVLLRVAQPHANHNGGQLQVGPDRQLYVGMGDGGGGGDPEGNAQDPGSRLGKLLRLELDASPAEVEVYAIGLRNPWRFSFDRRTGGLWIGDVGQNTLEEVDYLPPGTRPGVNFGWNGYEGSAVYEADAAARLDEDGLVWPVSEYGRNEGQSVTGGYVYRGTAIPGLQGRYVFGDFSSGRVWVLDGPGGPRARLPGADGEIEQLASFGEDAAGELYLVSLAGSIYKVVPAGP